MYVCMYIRASGSEDGFEMYWGPGSALELGKGASHHMPPVLQLRFQSAIDAGLELGGLIKHMQC